MSATASSEIKLHEAEKAKRRPAWWQTRRAHHTGLVAAILAVIGLLTWYFAFRPYVKTDDARVAMTLVRVAPSGISGRVESVHAEEGTLVKKGDVLVEIDHRIAQANYDKAKAKADLAQIEYARLQRLVKEGSATAQALQIAQAGNATASAELKQAEVALENTYLKSPFDGIVVQKLTDPGNLLEAGQAAMIVADQEHAWIAANIEETAVGEVKPGQSVHITIDEGGTLEGKVTEVRAAAASQFALIPSDTGSGNFTKVVQRIPIKIAPEAGQVRALRAGQSVEIKIRVK